MQSIPSPVHSPTWAFGILALLAMGLAVVALVAIVTALVAARKPIVRWETLKVLALAALCIVPALAVVGFIGYFTVVPVASHHRSAQSAGPDFHRGRAYINGLELSADGRELRVLSSRPDCPASAAGLKRGDLILSVDGFKVGQIGAHGSVDKLRNKSGPVAVVIGTPVSANKMQVKTVELDLRRLRGTSTSGDSVTADHAAAAELQSPPTTHASDTLISETDSAPSSEEAVQAAARVEPQGHDEAPADALAVRPETLGQFLHAGKTERQAPDWAEKGSVPADDGVLVPLSSQRFATLTEAEQQVTAEAMAYVRKFYSEEYPLSGDWTVPVSLIEKHAVREIVGEELEKDFGKMYRVHVRLSLDSATRRAVHESWHDQIALHRLMGFGSALGVATLVLGTVAGYLKLDALTDGQYRRRLKLAAAALLAAGGLFAVIA